MKSQSWILLLVATVCGLVAMFGVQKAISQKPESAEEMVSVLQAALEIQPGDLLNETNTRLVQVNLTACPADAVRDPAQIVDRSVKVPAAPGDWILAGKLTERGEIGAAANIPAGMRAVTIPVDATQTHSGMLRPGNRVDLILTLDMTGQGAHRRKAARTILQYVEVFAVDDRIYGNDKTGDGSAGAKNISVLVTPEQGNMLRLASQMGLLSTSLRSNGDKAELDVVEVTDETLLNTHGANNVGAAAVMENRDQLQASDVPVLFEDVPPLPIEAQIRAELSGAGVPAVGGSEPVIELAEVTPKNVWTIEIREGKRVRLETVELPDDAESVSAEVENLEGSFWDFLKQQVSETNSR